MPSAAPRVCRRPGCNALAYNGTMCDPHEAAKPKPERYDDDRPSATARGYDTDWTKLRYAFIHAYPLCADCFERGITRPADEVHHVIPIATDPTLRLEWGNLRSLCIRCHKAAEMELR